MPMYRYTGPLTSLTLTGVGDVILRPGCTVELPDCDVVAVLAAMGRLQPVSEPAPAEAAAPVKPKKGE
jgi:hypothetical protein